MMPYISTPHPEDNVFGDIRGVISHALQVSGYDQGIQQVAVVAGRLAHACVHGLEDLPVHVVDQIVALEHGLRHVDIGSEEGVQGISHHADAELGHARYVNVKRRVGTCRQVHHALRDIHGLIAYALEVGIDLDAGDDETQVHCHGLLHGQEIDGKLIHVSFGGVDLGFVTQNKLAQSQVSVLVGAYSALHRL